MAVKTSAPATVLTRIEQHPAVAPLQSEKCALLNKQRTLLEALNAAHAVLREGVIEDAVAQRQAKMTAIVTEEQLQEACLDLREIEQRLDRAISTAKAEVRPLLEAEATPALETLERAMLELLAAQGQLLALEAKARRFGINLWLRQYTDEMLVPRLQRLQGALSKRQG